MKALSGSVRLGKVLMRAGEPIALSPGGDVRAAVLEVIEDPFGSIYWVQIQPLVDEL